MTCFVLVHGAWHGGWCWGRVAPLLREAGYDALAPSLTGLGDRQHLLTPQVGMATHADDILHLVESRELEDVILCGHSYGGAVLSAVAPRVASHLAALVYLDATLLSPGQCVLETMLPERRAAVLHAAETRGEGWRVPLSPALTGENDRQALDRLWGRFGVNSPADRAWLERRCTDHPLKSFVDRLAEPDPPRGSIARHYLLATQHRPSAYHEVAQRLRGDPAWTVGEIDAGHEAMVTHPRELADTLSRIAAAR